MRTIPGRALALLVSSGLVLGACGGDDTGATGTDETEVSVVAAFYPLAEAARQVGGDRVTVSDLTPAGGEPHDLELTTGQVDAIEDADLVVVLGRDFQPAVEDVADRRSGPAVVVLDALEGIGAGTADDGRDHRDEGEDAHDHRDGALDPHVWLDVTKMREIVQVIEDALVAVDPEGTAIYEANAERYEAALDTLDRELVTGLADCERREIVTAHAAFGWLADRYDLEQHAIAGISPDDEPSASRLAELADLARDEGVTTVFTETLVSDRVARALAREAGGLRTAVLNPLEGLTREQREAGADYLSVMRENLAVLRDALGCS